MLAIFGAEDVDGTKVWSNVNNKLVDGTGTGIGDGKENTKEDNSADRAYNLVWRRLALI